MALGTPIQAAEPNREVVVSGICYQFDAHGLHGRYLARPGLDGWMADIMHRAERSGHLHMSVMSVGSRICAAQLAFQSKSKITGYFSAFDISLSRNAVGKLHLQDLITDIFEHNLVLDLMPPSDSYKCEWGVEATKVAAYTVPLTRWGAVVSQVYSVRTRSLAKAAYLRLPNGVRAGIAAGTLDVARKAKRLFAGSGPAAPVPTPVSLVAKPQKD
ncbi:MAG: GNAT family N-acetyltransferase [Halocynthiibacter sp.]